MNSQHLDFLRRSRSDALRRLASLGRHPSIGRPTTVARIDDPDGRCSILAVRGMLDARSIDQLWSEVTDPAATSMVHLDVTDASILPGPWMAELEALANALESAGYDVRIVGLNPKHPDLWGHGRPS